MKKIELVKGELLELKRLLPKISNEEWEERVTYNAELRKEEVLYLLDKHNNPDEFIEDGPDEFCGDYFFEGMYPINYDLGTVGLMKKLMESL